MHMYFHVSPVCPGFIADEGIDSLASPPIQFIREPQSVADVTLFCIQLVKIDCITKLQNPIGIYLVVVSYTCVMV